MKEADACRGGGTAVTKRGRRGETGKRGGREGSERPGMQRAAIGTGAVNAEATPGVRDTDSSSPEMQGGAAAAAAAAAASGAVAEAMAVSEGAYRTHPPHPPPPPATSPPILFPPQLPTFAHLSSRAASPMVRVALVTRYCERRHGSRSTALQAYVGQRVRVGRRRHRLVHVVASGLSSSEQGGLGLYTDSNRPDDRMPPVEGKVPVTPPRRRHGRV